MLAEQSQPLGQPHSPGEAAGTGLQGFQMGPGAGCKLCFGSTPGLAGCTGDPSLGGVNKGVPSIKNDVALHIYGALSSYRQDFLLRTMQAAFLVEVNAARHPPALGCAHRYPCAGVGMQAVN